MSIQRIQEIDHAIRLVDARMETIHSEEQRCIAERARLWLEKQRLENERAAIMSSRLVDA